MQNAKQTLRLIGAIFLLFLAFYLPLMTCIQKATTHLETEATVTEVRVSPPSKSSRRAPDRNVQYAYTANGTEYQGYDPVYEVDASVKPGDKVMIIYSKNDPTDSRVSEFGFFGLKVTLTALVLSGYLIFTYFRNRQQS